MHETIMTVLAAENIRDKTHQKRYYRFRALNGKTAKYTLRKALQKQENGNSRENAKSQKGKDR